jgi:hypothetical protein
MKRKVLGLTFAWLLVLTTSGTVGAATIGLDFISFIGSGSVQRSFNSGVTWENATAALFHFQRTGGDFGPTATDIYTFCIEAGVPLNPNPVLYNVDELQNAPDTGPMGPAKADLLRELYGKYFPVSTSAISATVAQALQIATWEIVREEDGLYNVTGGTAQFRYNDAATALAQTYLTDIVNNDNPMRTNILAAINEGTQDVWFSPVPEPSSMILLGLGLVIIGKFARRRRE